MGSACRPLLAGPLGFHSDALVYLAKLVRELSAQVPLGTMPSGCDVEQSLMAISLGVDLPKGLVAIATTSRRST